MEDKKKSRSTSTYKRGTHIHSASLAAASPPLQTPMPLSNSFECKQQFRNLTHELLAERFPGAREKKMYMWPKSDTLMPKQGTTEGSLKQFERALQGWKSLSALFAARKVLQNICCTQTLQYPIDRILRLLIKVLCSLVALLQATQILPYCCYSPKDMEKT